MLRKFVVNVNGKEYVVEMEEIGALGATTAPVVEVASVPAVTAAPAAVATPVAVPVSAAAPVVAPAAAATPVPTGEGETIIAPMPGTILSVLVKVGDTVAYEQGLVVLEAMKMENEIVAPIQGTVAAIYVTEGSPIDVGEAIIKIV